MFTGPIGPIGLTPADALETVKAKLAEHGFTDEDYEPPLGVLAELSLADLYEVLHKSEASARRTTVARS